MVFLLLLFTCILPQEQDLVSHKVTFASVTDLGLRWQVHVFVHTCPDTGASAQIHPHRHLHVLKGADEHSCCPQSYVHALVDLCLLLPPGQLSQGL